MRERWQLDMQLNGGSESENDFNLKLSIINENSLPIIDEFTKKGKIRFVQADCPITEV